jgi:hypothetical protein
MSNVGYQSKIIANGYEILAGNKFIWSDEFTDSMKVELLTFMLEYYEGIEDWDACIKLKKLLDDLENHQ